MDTGVGDVVLGPGEDDLLDAEGVRRWTKPVFFVALITPLSESSAVESPVQPHKVRATQSHRTTQCERI